MAAAAAVGLALIIDSIWRSSATYDEVTYLRVAARWWRTGQQTEITRMGSPLTFWKVQQAPVLWTLDRLGRGSLIDDPIRNQETLLPIVRTGAAWIWLVALGLCAWWSRRLYGPRAMALAAWLFALSPNLIAHGGLITMELPLLACTTGMLLLFWTFVDGRRRWFWASAALGGLAFSCKYHSGDHAADPGVRLVVGRPGPGRRGGAGTAGRRGDGRLCRRHDGGEFRDHGRRGRPVERDQGRASQHRGEVRQPLRSLDRRSLRDADSPGLGRIRQPGPPPGGRRAELSPGRAADDRLAVVLPRRARRQGALDVLVPACRPQVAGQATNRRSRPSRRDPALDDRPVPGRRLGGLGANYGVRYLLPLAPLAIVWVSRLAEEVGASVRPGMQAGRAGSSAWDCSGRAWPSPPFTRSS